MGSQFEVAGAEMLGWGLGPGNREWMGGPETDGGYGEEDMLAWSEGPGPGEMESDAHRVTREDLDIGSACAIAADAAIDKGGKADETFDDPDGDHCFQVSTLLEAMQMYP